MASEDKKARVLLVGSGGIGTIAALNLELSNLASVTAVLRSNYSVVSQSGFKIKSRDYGNFESWRPSAVLSKVSNVAGEGLAPFDYIICTTKNNPDVPPTLVDLIKPAVTEAHSVIVMVQNGLNIERPILAAFPRNIVLSGVSRCGANEVRPGYVEQDDRDRLYIGAFVNPNLDLAAQQAAAQDFVKLYAACGKAVSEYDDNVAFVRWRKLLYNAVWNPTCALTQMDTSRIRLACDKDDPYSPVNTVVRPAMREVRAAAKAVTGGEVDLPESVIEDFVAADDIDLFCKPSMQQDAERGRFIEYQNLLGEALRDGEKAGVPMPTVRTLYGLCKAMQWRTREKNENIDVDKLVKNYQGC